VIENFTGTKSWRKILEGLKRKVGIFIEFKNIFNPKQNYQKFKMKVKVEICRVEVDYFKDFLDDETNKIKNKKKQGGSESYVILFN